MLSLKPRVCRPKKQLIEVGETKFKNWDQAGKGFLSILCKKANSTAQR